MRALLLALVACGDGPGTPSIRGEPTFETFEHRMCACRDPACAKQVVTEMAEWSQKVRAPRDNLEATKQILGRYNTCMTEANRTR